MMTFKMKPELFINFHRAAEKPEKGFIPESSPEVCQPMGIYEKYTDSALREVEREIDTDRNRGMETGREREQIQKYRDDVKESATCFFH